MEVSGLVPVVLLLAVQLAPCLSLQDLTCFNDYIKNISCTWKSSGRPPEEHCVLQDELGHGKSCELGPAEGQDRTIRTCQLVFYQVSGYRYKVTIKVVCGGSVVTRLKDYWPARNVKMHPPGKPVITKSPSHHNVSWSLGRPHSKMIPSYYFQLQLKQSDQPWKNAVLRNLTAKPSVELPEDKFEKGQLYEVRVRVKTSEFQQLRGVWSSWSPTATWRSEIGSSPGRDRAVLNSDKSRSLPVFGPELQVALGLVAAAVALLVLITCKFHRAGWVYKLKRSHVPNPSAFFHSLNLVHGGNFQKWLSPMFAPESFEVPQSFEDISTVEVFQAKDVTALLHATGSPWDSSAGSSCFSNMGYFFTEYPSSLQTEVCPMYFSYQGDAECFEGSGNVEDGVEVDDESFPPGALYERPQSPPGEVRPPDPGCREWDEEDDDEEEEEGEIRDDPKEIDHLSPLTILSLSPLGPVTPAHFPRTPNLPSIPTPPLASRDFDSDTAPGSSNTSGPAEGTLGRSSSERIEPSSGGYMSVMEMLNTYCNKSI